MFSSTAYAYLDGGFINMVIQVFVASFAILMIYFRTALYKIKEFLNKIIKKQKKK